MSHGSIINVITDLDTDDRSPTNANPPNCTNDPNMTGNAMTSSKEDIADCRSARRILIAEFALEPKWLRTFFSLSFRTFLNFRTFTVPFSSNFLLRPDVQRGCRLESTLLKADSGPVALCLPIMIQNCLINCNFRAIRLRRRIILAGEERRLLAAEAAESYLEKKAARSASFAEKTRQIAPKSPRTM